MQFYVGEWVVMVWVGWGVSSVAVSVCACKRAGERACEVQNATPVFSCHHGRLSRDKHEEVKRRQDRDSYCDEMTKRRKNDLFFLSRESPSLAVGGVWGVGEIYTPISDNKKTGAQAEAAGLRGLLAGEKAPYDSVLIIESLSKGSQLMVANRNVL